MVAPGTAEIAQMRTAVTGLLPDTCNILSLTYAMSEGYGVETWGTASTSVPCRLDYKQGFEAGAGGAIVSFSRWTLSLPATAVLTAANRVEIGTIQYNVKSVDAGRSWALAVRAEVDPA